MNHIGVDFEITHESMESLILMYQPVFSVNALNLYLTLYTYGKYNQSITNTDLTKLLQEPIDLIVSKRQELERFNLLQTYKDEAFTLILKAPLTPSDFLKHPVFGRLYSIVAGQEAFKALIMRYTKKPLEIKGEDITKVFDSSRLQVWDATYEKDFDQAAPSLTVDTFNVDRFFASIPAIVYPMELRTSFVRDLVKEIGSLYHVDYETMKRLIIESSNFETHVFNTRKFVFLVEKTFGKMKVDEKRPYAVDPISFLRYKQGYDYVTDADRNLLHSLSQNFGFSSEVINVLIEYILDNNNMNINKNYVEKIAATWKRKEIDSVKKAQDEIQSLSTPSTFKPQTQKKGIMPTFSDDASIEEDENEIRRRIKEMLEGDS